MSEFPYNTEDMRQAVAAGYRHWGSVGLTGTEDFDRWLNAERARVWDEGHLAGASDGTSDDWVSVNPYEREAGNE